MLGHEKSQLTELSYHSSYQPWMWHSSCTLSQCNPFPFAPLYAPAITFLSPSVIYALSRSATSQHTADHKYAHNVLSVYAHSCPSSLDCMTLPYTKSTLLCCTQSVVTSRQASLDIESTLLHQQLLIVSSCILPCAGTSA